MIFTQQLFDKMDIRPIKISSGENVTGEDGFCGSFVDIFHPFNRKASERWMTDNWTWCIYSIGLYIAFLFIGQEVMKNRKPFDLKNWMILWNFSLAVFSVSACFTIIPEMINVVLPKDGWHQSCCSSSSEISDDSLFWAWLFVLSKLVELGDTVFLVLRKRKVIFLHWYHHVTVLFYAWFSYGDQISTARWFIVVNYLIHSVMYSYYGLRAMNVHVPKIIAMSITFLQITQMILGVTVNVYAYIIKLSGKDCSVSMTNLYMSFAIYASYFFLFANFFQKTYFGRKTDKGKKASRPVEAWSIAKSITPAIRNETVNVQ